MHALPTLHSVTAKLDQVRGMMVPVPESSAVGGLFNVIASEVETLRKFRTPPQDGLSRVWAALLALEDLIHKALLRVQLSKQAEVLREAKTLDEKAAESLESELEAIRDMQIAAAEAVLDAFGDLTQRPYRQPGPSEKQYKM